ncbi:hypothetical protein L249_7943 [Ophiocordyceps polyrhachis-furcata BCC 54312]|uniref:Uncharacterized protein n=1 Tax=Ophiocordyceps polyrhachis-furcata BCC 54312 TaxID=1330021 RepID=A0A367LHI7_9HYPO|nr:hypothetical protein L249_7943 [Ophiocordyceps polyrhachis-furcata BCC 54312]
MAAQPATAKALDALQYLVNDVLVQTGKALRASRRDGHSLAPPTHGALPARLPDTIKAFHAALDELDHDIIRTKSVILRDLKKVQSRKVHNNEHPPPPVEVPPASPRIIDVESSPAAGTMDHQSTKTEPAKQPVAPFPDMGMSLPEAAQPSVPIKEEHTPAHDVTVEGVGPAAVIPTTERQSIGDQHHPTTEEEDTLSMNTMNPGLNFTDMEFTLAPTNNDSQDHPVGDAVALAAAEPSFDLASFVPADGVDDGNAIGSSNNNQTSSSSRSSSSSSSSNHKNHNNKSSGNGNNNGNSNSSNNNNNNNNMASLDSILPANLTAPSNAPTDVADGHVKPNDGRNAEAPDAAFAGIFAGEGQADGMDFDFSIGDSGMGDTFDDLMIDRDNTYSTLEHGDYDAAFFGLEKPNGT